MDERLKSVIDTHAGNVLAMRTLEKVIQEAAKVFASVSVSAIFKGESVPSAIRRAAGLEE